MEQPANKRFFHNASAFAVGGQVSVPGVFDDVLETQAATSLPAVGGHSVGRAEHYSYRRPLVGVSFERAESQVTGYRLPNAGAHQAVATVTVTKLNIMDRVKAERVVARLVSTEHEGEVKLLPAGSFFEGLTIDGFAVTPVYHEVLLGAETFGSLREKASPDRLKGGTSPFADPDGKPFPLPALGDVKREAVKDRTLFRPFQDCYVLTSIFSKLVVAGGYLKIEGTSVVVPDFGRVHLGEFLISREARLLTMIVCDLGCPVVGRVAAGGLRGNGSGY
jgi:hypothetical protein